MRALVLTVVLVLAFTESLEASAEARRRGKFFNLFNVVTFENGPCRSSSSISGDRYRNGTCLTSTECGDRGGSINGNCAAGFGACCVFTKSSSTGGTVSENCTYIQNPNFPSAMTDTDTITWTVEKTDNDVCDLRLDFETFTIVGPTVTTEVSGGACTDSLVVESRTGTTIPTVCGDLTGEHMYINLGNQDSDSATLTFAFSGTSTTRQFDIKVTQIECNNENRPPNGCLQFFVGTQGRIKTFNFATSGTTHLASQDYSACIRQEEGFSCVEYMVCSDFNAQGLTLETANGNGRLVDAWYDTRCTEDWIVIEGSTTECTCGATNVPFYNKYCGVTLSPGFEDADLAAHAPVCDCTPPFFVGVHTDATADIDNANTQAILSSGACLDYRQIAC